MRLVIVLKNPLWHTSVTSSRVLKVHRVVARTCRKVTQISRGESRGWGMKISIAVMGGNARNRTSADGRKNGRTHVLKNSYRTYRSVSIIDSLLSRWFISCQHRAFHVVMAWIPADIPFSRRHSSALGSRSAWWGGTQYLFRWYRDATKFSVVPARLLQLPGNDVFSTHGTWIRHVLHFERPVVFPRCMAGLQVA